MSTPTDRYQPQMVTSESKAAIVIDPPAFGDMDYWHDYVAELRRTEPVSYIEAQGWKPFYAILDHPGVLEVSRRNDLFVNHPRSTPGPEVTYDVLDGLGVKPQTLVQLHGHEHQQHRMVTNDWFKPAAVKNLQPAIDSLVEEFLGRLQDFDGECDFAQEIAVPFTIRVIMSIFGVPEEDEPLMLDLTQGLFGAADPEYLGEIENPFELVLSSVQRFEEYFASLAADRVKKPADDLATVIAHGMVDGEPMDENHKFWYYVIVATAGHDTTSFGLSGGLAELLKYQDQVQQLRDDPTLVGNAAEEMIRWTSPVRSFMRTVTQDTELRGVKLSAGDEVLTCYPSANRDENVFDNPMKFNVARTDVDKLLSFGLGVHYCLGAQVARREIRSVLLGLLEKTTSIELAGEPQFSLAHFVSGCKHLPISYQLK